MVVAPDRLIYQHDVDGFEEYAVETNATPAAYIATVGLLVALALALAAPLACWSRALSERRKVALEPQPEQQPAGAQHGPQSADDEADGGGDQQQPQQEDGGAAPPLHQQATETGHSGSAVRRPAAAAATLPPPPPNVADLGIFHREHLAAMKAVAQATRRTAANVAEPPGSRLLPHSYPGAAAGNRVVDTSQHSSTGGGDRLSAVPSVATTSRLYQGNGQHQRKRRPLQSCIPWRQGRALPRPAVVQQAVVMERNSYVSGGGDGGEGISVSHHSKSRSNSCWGAYPVQSALQSRSKVMSEAAGSVLEGETVEGEAEFYRSRFRTQRSFHRQSSSAGGSDLGSIMPPLDPDAISPEDAADANDPGRSPHLIQQYERQTNQTATTSAPPSLEPSNAFSAQFLNILDLAELDYESKRILVLAIPSTIGAMADPFFRIVLVAIISHFIDTDSMVAYLIVILFIRLTTEEISGAIADTESNMLQDALMQGGDLAFFQAGQTIQLAIFVQLVVGIPVLLIWYFLMGDVANWLVDDPNIADIASTYTGVIIIDYILRGASRTFMLPFYLTGQAQFEANIDLVATILTLVAIAFVATTNDLSLAAIGWVQVIIGIAKTIIKVAYVTLKGWLQPYKQGLLQTAAFKVSCGGLNFRGCVIESGALLELQAILTHNTRMTVHFPQRLTTMYV